MFRVIWAVVPFECDACKASSVEFFGDFVVLLESLAKMIQVGVTNIPKKFINEYTLEDFVHDGWVYFEMQGGMYGLPQAGILANNLLCEHLAKFD